MTSKPVRPRRRVVGEFRLIQSMFAALFLATTYWLVTTERLGMWKWLLVPILALVGLFAFIDVFNGPFGRRRR